MKNKIKILIIRLSSMGDIVLTTAFVRILKNKFPDAEIDFLLNDSFADIYKFNPHISKIIRYNKNYNAKQIKELKNSLKDYDYIFDLQKNRRSLFLTKGISGEICKIKKDYLNKLSLVYFKRSLYPEIRTIHQKYMDTASVLDLKDDEKGLEIWLEKEEKTKIYDATPYKNTIVLAPGAFHNTKKWLPERFKELAEKIIEDTAFDIKLTGGKGDADVCGYIAGSNHRIQNYAGKTSILETAELINGCRAIVTNDTGVMHIAVARQVPTIAIFGSTVKDFGFAPFRAKHKIIEKDISCRPCTHIGRKKCPKQHFRCMADITVDDVYYELINFLD
jgi:lipopolysaccharide heptosyltransferase II